MHVMGTFESINYCCGFLSSKNVYVDVSLGLVPFVLFLMAIRVFEPTMLISGWIYSQRSHSFPIS